MTPTTALRRTVLAAAFACAFVPVFLTAQAPKPIALEDYARFKRIGGAALSSDGKWMAYTVTPNDGDGTLFVQSLDTATKAHDESRAARAPSFSPSAPARRVFRGAGVVARTRRGRPGRRADAADPGAGGDAPAAAPPPRAFELLDLPTARRRCLPSVASFCVFTRRRLDPDSPAGGGDDGCPGRGGRRPAADAAARMRHPQRRTGAAGPICSCATSPPASSATSANVGSVRVRRQRCAHGVHRARPGRLGNGVYMMTHEDRRAGDARRRGGGLRPAHLERQGHEPAVLRGDKARDKAQKDNVLLAWTNVAHTGEHEIDHDRSGEGRRLSRRAW